MAEESKMYCTFATMNRTTGKILDHAGALFTVALWGFTFISSKQLINAGLTPAWIFTLRFSMAYIGMWVLCLLPKARKSGAAKLWAGRISDEIVLLLLGMTGGSIYFMAENSSLKYTQACNASFIVCTAPLFTMLFTLALKRFRHKRIFSSLEEVKVNGYLIFGTLLALCGLVMVVFSGYELKLSPKGDFLALGASLLWAVYSIFTAPMTERYGALMVTRKVFFYGLLTIIPFLFFGKPLPGAEVLAQPVDWGNLLFLGVAASHIGYIIWDEVLLGLGNVKATNYIYLNPVFTLIAAVLVLGERMTALSGTGSALILLGVILAGMSGRKS